MIYYSAFSLIETTVAILIICIGVLGIAALQLSALRQTETAYYQSVATSQALSLLERLRVNTTSAAKQREFKSWNQQNHYLLPQGQGSYHCGPLSCTVTLRWRRAGAQQLQFKKSLL